MQQRVKVWFPSVLGFMVSASRDPFQKCISYTFLHGKCGYCLQKHSLWQPPSINKPDTSPVLFEQGGFCIVIHTQQDPC